MTMNKAPTGYNKEQQKELLEKYEEYLIDSDTSEYVIRTRMTSVKTFFRTFDLDPHKVTSDDMVEIQKVLTAKYSEKTASKYLPSIGNFVCFLTGHDPWQGTDNGASWNSQWMDTVRKTPCHLNKEIRVWSEHLKKTGYQDGSIEEKVRMIRICIGTLNITVGRKAVEDYTLQDIEVLEQKLCDISDTTRIRYIRNFARFLEFYSGIYLLNRYKNADLDIIMQEWAMHLREQGMKESTVSSRVNIVVTVLRNLKREFGREFSPEEVDARVLTAYFNRAIDHIKEVTLCNYFTAFASFSEWLNGTTGF